MSSKIWIKFINCSSIMGLIFLNWVFGINISEEFVKYYGNEHKTKQESDKNLEIEAKI